MTQKKATALWLSAGILLLLISGVIGDNIFFPHPENFSFRVLSNYGATGILLIVAATIWNSEWK